VGTPYCPYHPQNALEAQTVSQMVDAVLAMPAGTRLMILAPVLANRKGEHADLFDDLRAQGFVRVRLRTEAGAGSQRAADAARIVNLDDEVPVLAKGQKHSVDVVVDRIKVADSIQQRLAESFETALRIADGRALVVELDGGREHLF
jgi:excinuclease ABC subunit A